MVFFNELFQTVRLSKWYLHFDTPSFYVYAWHEHYLTGGKSRVSPNSGNYIGKSKGVHREVKSEGSWR